MHSFRYVRARSFRKVARTVLDDRAFARTFQKFQKFQNFARTFQKFARIALAFKRLCTRFWGMVAHVSEGCAHSFKILRVQFWMIAHAVCDVREQQILRVRLLSENCAQLQMINCSAPESWYTTPRTIRVNYVHSLPEISSAFLSLHGTQRSIWIILNTSDLADGSVFAIGFTKCLSLRFKFARMG